MRYKLLILFLFILFLLPHYVHSQNRELAKLELLKAKLKSSQEDTNKVKLLNSISFQYNSIDPTEGILYGKKSLDLAKKLDWQSGMALSYNSIGGNLYAQGNFKDALSFFEKSLKININSGNEPEVADNYGNIGNINYNLSNYTLALMFYQKALKIDTKINDKSGIATNLGSIGNIYNELSNFKSSLSYYRKALKIHQETNNQRGVATILGNIGITEHDMKNYKEALNYFDKALEIWELFGNKYGISTNLGNIANTYYNLNDYPKALEYYNRALKMNEELGEKFGLATIEGNLGILYFKISQDTVIQKLKANNSKINLDKNSNIRKAIEYSERATKLALEIGSKDMLIGWYITLDKANSALGKYEKAYQYQEIWTNLRDSVFSVEKTKEIAELEATKQKEINEKELRLKDLQLTRKKNEQLLLFISIGGIIIVLIIILLQRRKSERLLLNVLPAKIARRLKNNEKSIADRFENAAIIFIDIVGFTSYSKDTDPVKVVSSLNNIFTKFDHLAMEFGLEKIKTIGDCYMAAAGLPEPHSQPIIATALFAIKAKKLMQNYITEDGYSLHFRIGIDAGPVVAGVIGERKFSYDLWGDAVNTASRMESTGLPNEIQVTESFAKQLVNKNIICEERGEIEIKGKGMVKTYLLREIKPEKNDMFV